MVESIASVIGEDALAPQHRVGEALLAALTGRDFADLEACFQPDVRFRALIPPGVRDTMDAKSAAHFRRWFGDVDELTLQQGHVRTVVDRLYVSYRLLVVDSDGHRIVEQQAYCDVEDGSIARMDLLCSGIQICPAVER